MRAGRSRRRSPGTTAGRCRRPAEIDRRVGAERLFALTGVGPEFSFTLAKLLWMRKHWPEALARAPARADDGRLDRVPAVGRRGDRPDARLAHTVLRRRGAMPGRRNCSRSPGLTRISRRRFASAEPRSVRSGLRCSRRPGFSGTPTVGVGGHDHIVGAMACGLYRPGTLVDSMGTAEPLMLGTTHPLARLRRDPPRLSSGADRTRTHVLGRRQRLHLRRRDRMGARAHRRRRPGDADRGGEGRSRREATASSSSPMSATACRRRTPTRTRAARFSASPPARRRGALYRVGARGPRHAGAADPRRHDRLSRRHAADRPAAADRRRLAESGCSSRSRRTPSDGRSPSSTSRSRRRSARRSSAAWRRALYPDIERAVGGPRRGGTTWSSRTRRRSERYDALRRDVFEKAGHALRPIDAALAAWRAADAKSQHGRWKAPLSLRESEGDRTALTEALRHSLGQREPRHRTVDCGTMTPKCHGAVLAAARVRIGPELPIPGQQRGETADESQVHSIDVGVGDSR